MIEICRGVPGAEYYAQVLDVVAHHGWVMEHGRASGGRNLAVASTLGLSLRGHPEFLVFGCDADEAFRLLEPLAEAVESGSHFDESDDLDDLYPGALYGLLRFHDSTSHLPTVNALFRRTGTAPIPALQLLHHGRGRDEVCSSENRLDELVPAAVYAGSPRCSATAELIAGPAVQPEPVNAALPETSNSRASALPDSVEEGR